jgi:site-specific DNA recombinase
MAAAKLRCAIYTRKSSDEGLEQDYNSLHAQRDACEAYIKSQAGEGWQPLAQHYDDGGISGATMERPALKRLLADIDGGKVDVVVVYKVDRLTRSLGDFARIVEVFDKHGVSFVSVTQSFNTTSSMGRLTLNVLLSFAQFEREVTGERIRDKIAQSKARGLWMGGNPPLGYEPDGRTLKINEDEAELVRRIFDQYLALESVTQLCRSLNSQGYKPKSRRSADGRGQGGFTNGPTYHLLKNRIYVGEIVHKGVAYQGQHPPIIDRELFDAVQASLASRTRRRGARATAPSPPKVLSLAGKLFDANGGPMTPTTSVGARGATYRYYVSTQLLRGQVVKTSSDLLRLPGLALERWVLDTCVRLLPDSANASACLTRVDVYPSSVQVAFDPKLVAKSERHRVLAFSELAARLAEGEQLSQADGLWSVFIPQRLQFRGGRSSVQGKLIARAKIDRTLVSGLQKAHQIVGRGIGENGQKPEARRSAYDRALMRLAFLAPDLQDAILSGAHPQHLCLEHLRHREIPLCWDDQRTELR